MGKYCYGLMNKRGLVVLGILLICGCKSHEMERFEGVYAKDRSAQILALERAGQASLEISQLLPVILELSKDSDDEVAQAAQAALLRLRAGRLVEELRLSPTPEGRGGSAWTLRMMLTDDATHHVPGLVASIVLQLTAGLQDSDAFVRGRSAEALGVCGQEAIRVADALIAALHDNDAWVRNRACYTLGYLEYEPAAVSLASLLHDSDATVRMAAADALGMIKPAVDVEEALEQLARDPDPQVSGAAAEALRRIRGAHDH